MKTMLAAVAATALAGIAFGTASAADVSVTTNQPANVSVYTSTPTAAAGVATSTPTAAALPASQDVGQAQEVAGTVQSVDRQNHNLVVQDPQGRNIGVTWNDNVHIYRRGEEIQFRDVEPNDHIDIHIAPAS